MLDHIFISVSDPVRSIAFYERVLPVLGIVNRHDYDGAQGPHGHPNLKGFGANGRIFFWLRQGTVCVDAVHVGFIAESESMVNAAHAEALAAGAPKFTHRERRSIMTLVITQPRSETQTDIALSLSIKAGNTIHKPYTLTI